MKKILTLAFLLLIVTSIEAQKMQQISVYKNGNVLYSSILTVSDSIKFSKFTVPVTTSGVDINGVIWATCNVNTPKTFTSSPSEYGMFYQWNRPVGWSSSNPLENHDGGTEWDNNIPSGDTWEISNNVCPSGWRLPT